MEWLAIYAALKKSSNEVILSVKHRVTRASGSKSAAKRKRGIPPTAVALVLLLAVSNETTRATIDVHQFFF